jgi:hypothetical protein
MTIPYKIAFYHINEEKATTNSILMINITVQIEKICIYKHYHKIWSSYGSEYVDCGFNYFLTLKTGV